MDWLNGILSKENCLVEIAKFDFKKFMYDYYNEYLKGNTVAGKNKQIILEKCPYRGELANKDSGIEQFLAYRTADEILEKKVRLFDCDSSNDTCDVTTALYKILWNYSKNSKESLWGNTDSEESKKLWKWTKDNKEENLDTYTSFGGDTMNSFLTTYNFCKDSIDKDSELKSGLEKLAVFTHTIGNFVLVPYGFNKARYGSTRDYWDASLDILQKEGFIAKSGKHFENDNLVKYINIFFLWDYIGENGELLPLFNKGKRKFIDEQKYGMLTSLDDAKDFLHTVNKAIYRRGIFMAGQLCIALGISLDEDFIGKVSEECTNVTIIYQEMSNWLAEKEFNSYEEYFLEIFKWLDEKKDNREADNKKELERVKSILKAVYAEMFIDDVEILRNDNEKCEVEVCQKAMQLYKKYPYYKEWKEIPCESVYLYYKNYVENKENAQAPYVLVNPVSGIAVTADILTSIRGPINCLTKNKYCNVKVEDAFEIIHDIQNEECLPEEYNDLNRYIKAFSRVYYWCGNMMPMICNAKGQNDTWNNKLVTIFSFFQSQNVNLDFNKLLSGEMDGRNVHPGQLYEGWTYYIFKECFVKINYLNDHVDIDDEKNIVVKQIEPFANLKKDVDKYDKEKVKNWFINNTKLIIQRSYRIQYQFSKDWNDSAKDEENVKSIMRYIFKQAGFTENDIETENLATIF